MEKNGYIYILTNKHHTVLYTGVTSDLVKRVFEHKSKKIKGFSKKYSCDKLVYFQDCGGIEEAIYREKQIKAGSRSTKIELIEEQNLEWKDLSDSI